MKGKLQTTMLKPQTISNVKKSDKPYDLEKRTFGFASGIIELCQQMTAGPINTKLIGQLVNAAGSVGANYREANEALSKKDFLHRMKITRKECKESTYWLELLFEANPEAFQIHDFIDESRQLRNIFSAIIEKSK